MSATEKKAKRRVSRRRSRSTNSSSSEDEDVKPESEHRNTSSNDVKKQKGTKESHKETTEESDESQSDDDDASDAASTASESVTSKRRRSSTRNKTKQRSNDETKTGPSWGDYESKREVKRNTIASESISSHHFTNPKSAMLEKEDLIEGDIDNPGLLGIYYDSRSRQYFFFSPIEGQPNDFYCIPENEVYRSMFTLLHSISMYFLR